MHPLFEELEAYNPKWRTAYATLRAAAQSAQCLGLYYAWLRTPAGEAYRTHVASVPDVAALKGQTVAELDPVPGGDTPELEEADDGED